MITLLESQNPEGIAILQLLVSDSHRAAVIGITGYPGAGKSTMVAQLVAAYRGLGRKVGVLAVDISSPRTGGALLGDRIRMQEHTLDHGVYIRKHGHSADIMEGSPMRLATQRWCWSRRGTRSF